MFDFILVEAHVKNNAWGPLSNSRGNQQQQAPLENKPAHLRNTEDGSIGGPKLPLSSLLTRVEWHEVKLLVFVELFKTPQTFRV